MTESAASASLNIQDRIHVVGRGVVGERLRRMLGGSASHGVVRSVTATARGDDVVVLTTGGTQFDDAHTMMRRGFHVITTSSDVDDNERLLTLADVAEREGVSFVVGAATSPGLSGLLARRAIDELAVADEVHVALAGTAGPACARAHHRAMDGRAVGWHDGAWRKYMAGSGRELCWFPEPIGALDCYRDRSAEPILLQHVAPELERISHRRSARRRDRLTARLPMLFPPPSEGAIGGLRVEVRGADDRGGRQTIVTGIAELIGSATAATAAALAFEIVEHGLPVGLSVPGAASLPTQGLLRRIAGFGIRPQEFTGIPQAGLLSERPKF